MIYGFSTIGPMWKSKPIGLILTFILMSAFTYKAYECIRDPETERERLVSAKFLLFSSETQRMLVPVWLVRLLGFLILAINILIVIFIYNKLKSQQS